MGNLKKILLDRNSCKSIWFMRQAGRYLPEFRKIRSENKDFIKLCLNSDLSSEITLQPIKRFDLDSAIIFSDILMIPYALGQSVTFTSKRGPKLSKFDIKTFLKKSKKDISQNLSPIYKAIEITRKKLNKKKSLISFVGAPWTLMIYMLELKNSHSSKAQIKINFKEEEIQIIIKKLIEFCCIHIKKQAESGCDVVQIFDSWASKVPEDKFDKYCYAPNREIVEFCQKEKIPSICFPKGIGNKYKTFNEVVKPNGINLDYDIDPLWAKNNLKDVVLQGGMSPKLLLDADEEMFAGATKYIQMFKDIPYVFNLGHGLLPETDPDKVKKLIEFYRKFE